MSRRAVYSVAFLVLGCIASCSSSSTPNLPIYTDFSDGTCANGRIKCGDGCVDPFNHPLNCGTCGNACASGQVCVGGQCTASCPTGTTLCDGLCVVTANNAFNCGSCGNACAGGQACSNGACVSRCAANEVTAPAYSNEGPTTACSALTNDSSNCGSPGKACDEGQACQTGACTMECSGSANCSGVCTDLSSNANPESSPWHSQAES